MAAVSEDVSVAAKPTQFLGLNSKEEAMLWCIREDYGPKCLSSVFKWISQGKPVNLNVKFKDYNAGTREYDDMNPMIYALLCGNREAVRQLANSGKILPTTEASGRPMLHWAVETCDPVIVQTILNLNVLPTSVASNGTNALFSTFVRIGKYAALNDFIWEGDNTKQELQKWFSDQKEKHELPESITKNLKARYYGNIEICKMLLDLDKNKYMLTSKGRNSHYAFPSALEIVTDPHLHLKDFSGPLGRKTARVLSANSDELTLEYIVVSRCHRKLTATVIFDFRLLKKLFAEHLQMKTENLTHPAEMRHTLKLVEQLNSDMSDMREFEKKHAAERAAEEANRKLQEDESRRKMEWAEKMAIEAMRASEEASSKALAAGDLAVESKLKAEIAAQKAEFANQYASSAEDLSKRVFQAFSAEILLREDEDSFKRKTNQVAIQYYSVFFAAMRGKLQSMVVQNAGDLERQKNKFLDRAASAVSFIAGAIPIPLISKFVETAVANGIAAYSDHREASKCKTGVSSTSTTLSIEDFSKAIGLEVARHYAQGLDSFSKVEHIQELATKAAEEIVDGLKTGKLSKAEAMDYKDAAKQVAAIVIASKGYNEKFESLKRAQPKPAALHAAYTNSHAKASSTSPIPITQTHFFPAPVRVGVVNAAA